MKRFYIYLVITVLFFLNWVGFLILSAFYKHILIDNGWEGLVSSEIPIVIIFGFLVPVAIFATMAGKEREKVKAKVGE